LLCGSDTVVIDATTMKQLGMLLLGSLLYSNWHAIFFMMYWLIRGYDKEPNHISCHSV